MKAVTWQGKRDVQVKDVPDPVITDPNDVIIKVTSAAICGSDLHLYEVMSPFMEKGDILGHEAMGIVQQVGKAVKKLRLGDRVVIPANIACGYCFMCRRGLQSQCETTQLRHIERGAPIFGYSTLYGHVPGGQAQYLRVPHADYTSIKLPHGLPDERFLFLSDVLPTAWQAVRYATVPRGGTVVVLGLGPIGDMCTRVAQHFGIRVIGVDLVAERLARAQQHGVEVFDISQLAEDAIRLEIVKLTDGRGPDAVIDAVGMEAHGSPSAQMVQAVASMLPDPAARQMFLTAGLDRLHAFYGAIDVVRRGGTVVLAGVYAGHADPIPLDTLFDKQIQLRMGQVNVRRWTDELLALLQDHNAFDVDHFATHRLPLAEAPQAYDLFQKKQDGVIKVVLQP